MSEVSMNLSLLEQASQRSLQIRAQVAEFLSRGGQITVLPANARAEPEGQMPQSAEACDRRKSAFDKRISREARAKSQPSRARAFAQEASHGGP